MFRDLGRLDHTCPALRLAHEKGAQLFGRARARLDAQLGPQVVERDVRVVVIDSLTGYVSSMPSQQQLLPQVHDLLQYLSGQGVLTILIVSQHGILGPSLGGPVDVSYLADTVLLLRHFEADGAIRQAISVFKKRYGNHEKQIRQISMSEDGIRVGEPLSAFQGLLTGVPKFMGNQNRLNRPES